MHKKPSKTFATGLIAISKELPLYPINIPFVLILVVLALAVAILSSWNVDKFDA